jgi:hypothetical protein
LTIGGLLAPRIFFFVLKFQRNFKYLKISEACSILHMCEELTVLLTIERFLKHLIKLIIVNQYMPPLGDAGLLKKSFAGSITISIGAGLLGAGFLLFCLLHWAFLGGYFFGFFPGMEDWFLNIVDMSTHVCLSVFMLVFIPLYSVAIVGLSLVLNDHQKLRNTKNSIYGLVGWILFVPLFLLFYYFFVFQLRTSEFVLFGLTCIPIILSFYTCVSLFLPLRELGGEFLFNISVALLFVTAFGSVFLIMVPVNKRTGISLLPIELGLIVTFVLLVVAYARTAKGLNRIMYKLEHAPYEPIDLSQEFPSPFYRAPKEAKELVLDAEYVEEKDTSKFVSIDGKPLFLLKGGAEATASQEDEEDTFRPQLPPYLEHEKRFRSEKPVEAVTARRMPRGEKEREPTRGDRPGHVGKRRGRSKRRPPTKSRRRPSKPPRPSRKRSSDRSSVKGRRRGGKGQEEFWDADEDDWTEYEDDRYDD